MNGLTFIPLLAVVFVAMISRKVPAKAANTVLICGIVLNALGYFVSPVKEWAAAIGQFHFVAIVFALMVITMLIWGAVKPMAIPFEDKDAKVTDLTPWKYAFPAAGVLIVIIAAIYASFADFSVFKEGKPAYPAVTLQKAAVSK